VVSATCRPSDLIVQRAKQTGHFDDPVIRQEIAKVLIMSKAANGPRAGAHGAGARTAARSRKAHWENWRRATSPAPRHGCTRS